MHFWHPQYDCNTCTTLIMLLTLMHITMTRGQTMNAPLCLHEGSGTFRHKITRNRKLLYEIKKSYQKPTKYNFKQCSNVHKQYNSPCMVFRWHESTQFGLHYFTIKWCHIIFAPTFRPKTKNIIPCLWNNSFINVTEFFHSCHNPKACWPKRYAIPL